MSRKRSLTQRQKLFVEAYLGVAKANATLAAKMAGYSGTEKSMAVTASKLLRADSVKDAIKKEADGILGWSTTDLRAWWRSIICDPKAGLRERLQASQLLGKSVGAFVERHEHKHMHAHTAVQLSDAQLAGLAGDAIKALDRGRVLQLEGGVFARDADAGAGEGGLGFDDKGNGGSGESSGSGNGEGKARVRDGASATEPLPGLIVDASEILTR